MDTIQTTIGAARGRINALARAGVGPQPLPPTKLDPTQLAGTVVATARMATSKLGGLPNPSGSSYGVASATYQLTIDPPERLPTFRYASFADVVLEAQRRARANHNIAEAVLQARDGSWYIAAVRFNHSIPGHPGFDLLDWPGLTSIDLTRASVAGAVMAIVGASNGVNFSNSPWPHALGLVR